MRWMMLICLVVIAIGGATGAEAVEGPVSGPPVLASGVTCTQSANVTTCFYPAHDR